MRDVFVVMGAGSLPYAVHAMSTMLARNVEPLHLRLITDGPDDVARIRDAVGRLAISATQRVSVHGKAEIDERAEDRLARHPHVRQFREGHPCWRKITDPLLACDDGGEAVICDPDLYFPNRFAFEPTPARGLLLMWQRPNCLLPPETVEAAFAAGVRLADHGDIGVANVRAPLDLEWLDWLIGRLGGAALPRAMHVEAIVWSALAMRAGGGFLDPERWICWHNSQAKRLLRRAHVPGTLLLRLERLAGAKCFHAGGIAKWWVAAACDSGQMTVGVQDLTAPSPVRPFVELPPWKYHAQQAAKKVLRRAGYYRFMT